jgi:hypothetical protein
MQKENLTWAFQSQFFLAQLLPLCAFYYFSRAISQATFGFDFLLSCLLGFLSSLTMASGLLALPFLCMFCLISKQHLARLVVLSLLTIGSFICYFYGYVAVSGHGSPLQTFIHQPVEFMLYIFKYLGSPIAYLFKGVIIGKVLAVIAGVFLVLNYLYFGVSLVRVSAGKSWNLQRALICFGLYICTTAAVTAGGRLVFGTDQAFSGRYTTPALMAWAALFILYSPFILSKGQDKKWVFVAVFFLFFVSLFPQQLTAIRSDQDKIFEKSLAALALSLGVPDEQQISKVFPAPGYALMLSQKAMHEKITIFGAEPLIGLSEQLESNVSSVSYEKCKGGLEQVSALEGSKYSKISGWIYESKANDRPDLVLIIDGQGKIIGYGVAGQHWSIPSRPLGSPAERSDLSGYVLTKDIVGSTEINITSPFCNLKLN